ncbi:MAG: outer membrane protein transport protein [Planctomycetes bacterium]|nr:outer membrane protein transport protein [Planctomycetota bacterium]
MSGSSWAQMGHVLNGVGPVNQGMAGASTALPIDPSGALQWNPAAITGLERNTFEFGFELLMPDTRVRSSVGNGAVEGSTPSDAGDSGIPSFGMVVHLPDSKWSVGMGAFGISGFGVDYEASGSNPILMPPPNGFGTVYSQFQMLQLSPTIAYRFDDHWSFGFAPTINQAQLAVTPGCFAPPDDANNDGNPSYPDARSAAKAWGYGAQVGLYYQGDKGWNFGLSYKSNQQFEDFRYNSTDELGNRRAISLDMDFPAIASVGVGYEGLERWKFAADARYIDYGNTDGFDPATFNPDFSVAGFGWDSILVLALGAQYELTDRWHLRGGYSYNENPIPDANSTFNVAAPAVIQHHLAFGASFCFHEDSCIDLAYRHGFENSISGQMGHPTMGPVPGSEVENTLSTDSLLLGFRVSF